MAAVSYTHLYAGTTNQLRFELFKERYHLSETIDSLIAEREAIMIRLVRESDAGPTAGSVELLKSIKAAGLKTAVASSSSYPFILSLIHISSLLEKPVPPVVRIRSMF